MTQIKTLLDSAVRRGNDDIRVFKSVGSLTWLRIKDKIREARKLAVMQRGNTGQRETAAPFTAGGSRRATHTKRRDAK